MAYSRGSPLKRNTIIALLLFTFAEFLLGWGLYQEFKADTNKRLDFLRIELDTGVNSIVDSYRRAVELIFQESIDRPDVIALMEEANQADTEKRRKLRGRLYRKFYSTYKHLRQDDIRVLQFVLRDGSSFLRFNRPDLFDDNIAAERPVLEQVLESGDSAWAFENGRVYPGFRYAFPLVSHNVVTGVADFSVSFEAVRQVLLDVAGAADMETHFVFRRDLNWAVAHPSSRTLYRDTVIHPGYITEDESSTLRDLQSALPSPEYASRIDALLGSDPEVRAAIDAGQAYSLYMCPEGVCYGVVLRPVKDSIGRVAGYVIAYSPSSEYREKRDVHLLAFVIGSFLLLAIGTLIRRWLESRSHLRTISDSMAEGMYVMDSRGRTLYINHAAADLLGFTPDEVTGQSAHELFHVHSDNQELTPETCPIRTVPLTGKVYSSRAEVFQRKDGSTLRVEVSASPLSAGGEITGSVVLFRDITAEHEAQLRLQQTDIAFRNLSEAVMVTDAGATVIAVNRACTTITGYEEDEIVGQNPKIMASGRHDSDFYKDMWDSISNSGFWEGEIWNRRKDGEVYPEWLNITAVYSDSGELINYVGVFSDITELRRKEERLRDLAYHDQLTRLPNRAYFHELFEHAVERARRHNKRLAILYLDLDRFKHINDTLGHVTGDTLLQQVGDRLQESTRIDDDVARLGGDEFCVLLEDIDHTEDAARVARKLIEEIKEPFHISNKDLYVTVSVGISIFPEDGDGTTTLLKNADAAMYLAKNAGRNDFRYFTKTMADEAAKRFQMEGELREALIAEQFELYYQPKVDISGGKIVGLEALIRWNHPGEGAVIPSRFLDVAQDAGIMEQITEWVVRSAARQVRSWKEDGVLPGRVAVNIDTESFLKPDLAQRLVALVEGEGASPEDIELEVVEGSMAYEAHTTELWQELVNAGFVLSIDDFGTGESSLSRLKLLPVETLKVDQSFVRDIETSEDDRTIIRTIIAMGKSLGLKVLAEGVEEPEQLSFLHDTGCDNVQGYYFAKPLKTDAVTELLKENNYTELLQHQKGHAWDSDTESD